MSTKKLQIIGNFLEVDSTLTQTGKAADAKATGDAINQMQTSVDEIASLVEGLNGSYYTETEIDSMMADLNAAIDGKSDSNHIHDDLYYTETEIDDKLGIMQSDIDSKVNAVEGKGLSTNDYTNAEKDKLATVEANANFYEHPTHTAHNLGLYKVTVDDSGHVSGATLVEKEDIVALGIPEQDTTYDTDISDLNDRIDEVEDSITTTNETLSGLSQELESYKITNNEAVSTNADGIEANKTAIEAIQGDYLTSADKTQLQDQITKVSDKATENASAIEVLNGEGDGSVKQSITNAFNEFAANVSNDGVVNTYKELIDYAAAHGPEFTTLVGEVNTIEQRVGGVESDLSNYKAEISEQFTETDTTINNHIINTGNPHGVTKEQIGLDNVDNTADLDKPVSYAIQAALDEKADVEHTHEVGEVNGLQDLVDELQVNIDNHDENKDNPHVVTAEQVGAYTMDEVDTKFASLEILVDADDEGILLFNTNMLTDSGGNVDQSDSIFKGKTAFFYGDSLTEVNYHYTKGYHSWVKDLLGLASYNNYGVSGYKVSDVYNKVNSVTDTADIVFVMCGVNDQNFSVPLGTMGDNATGTTYGALNLLCALLKQKYPTSIVVFITPHYQTKYPHSSGVTSYEVSKAVREVCEKYAIPVYDNFVLSGIYSTNLSTFTTDNCHWNDIAHEMVGKNLAKFVTDNFCYVYGNTSGDGGDESGDGGVSIINNSAASATYTNNTLEFG